MSQDIVADALNMMMNAKKAGKEILEIPRHSKLLLSVLAIAKLNNYVKDYKIDSDTGILKIELGVLNICQAIKPRLTISTSQIEKYITRYLPSKDLGVLIISTSQGLVTHKTAIEKNIGGCLIAYMY